MHTCSPSWTPLPPPSLYHPSRSSQCTSPKHPVSCIKPGLAIHFLYEIIHVSMPFSQIIPPSPSPKESKRLVYTSVSLLLSCIQGYRYHLSKFHIYALVYCIGGEGNGNPLQYSCLENPMDGSLIGCSAWGREESDTTEGLHFHFSFSCTGEGNGNPLQCSYLENPRDREPGGLPSMGSHRVTHEWSDLAAAAVHKGKWRTQFSTSSFVHFVGGCFSH